MSNYTKKQSALKVVLVALIPYSRQNLRLSYSPNRFFNDLEKSSSYRQPVLKEAYRRAKIRGLVNDTTKQLTAKGLQYVQPYIATKLSGQAKLMVIFDIPETHATSRRRLRSILKVWGFEQIQKSVWISNFNYRDALSDIVSDLELEDWVEIYESARLYPS